MMKTEILDVDVKGTMAYTLGQLREKHGLWEAQKDRADKVLHRLMGECLSLYRLCCKSEVYEQALKSCVDFKFGKNTKLTIIISKAIFGNSKKHYAYAKALDKAIENQVGVDENMTMFDWLQQEGGINGVIRKSKEYDRSKDKEFGEYVLDGYYNFDRMKDSLKPSFTFENKHICNIVDEQGRNDCFLYAVVERGGEKVKIQPVPIAKDEVVKKMYSVFMSYLAEVGGEKYYDEFCQKKKQREEDHKKRLLKAKKEMVDELERIADMEID
ncbi:hypothetical protein [Marinobacter sp. DSM 26671]|uniref:hypothetical protein n=1 Tax=Marinobacter sp. DSM 26671 TaxID=1761793 RepID=UPI00111369C5|nr:hypothetical protein [Marinobacter sp. DSM 26671]